MPEFRPASDIAVESSGGGWTLETLADGRHVSGLAMAARLWRLEPGASSPEQVWPGEAERFLYVVSGEGQLVAGGQEIELSREDMVWIEAGDRFRLQAGDQPLSVLDATST
jgi:quercetin dioxygenase-like cupin family protein